MLQGQNSAAVVPSLLLFLLLHSHTVLGQKSFHRRFQLWLLLLFWCDDYQDRSFTTSLRLVVLSVALVTCLTGFPSCTQFPRARINSTSKEKGPRRYIVPPYGPLTKGEKREQPRPFSSLILNDILWKGHMVPWLCIQIMKFGRLQMHLKFR